jgi:hypothetical protein
MSMSPLDSLPAIMVMYSILIETVARDPSQKRGLSALNKFSRADWSEFQPTYQVS